MPFGTPIQITLYGDDDEEKGTYSRARVPVMYAERAMELSSILSAGDIGQDQWMALYQFIVDFYVDKFTIEELRRGTTTGELLDLLETIAMRSMELLPSRPNPPPPVK